MQCLILWFQKWIKRGISINSLEELKKEDSSGNRKYSYKIIDSIEKDEAKKIQTEIKNLKSKSNCCKSRVTQYELQEKT